MKKQASDNQAKQMFILRRNVMKMRGILVWCLGALWLICAGGFLMAEEAKNPFSASISAGYYSKYIWRGQNINDESVLQTNVSGSAYGFTGAIWTNLDLTKGSHTAPDNFGEISEIDYSLDYTKSVNKVGFSLGVIHYMFPNTSLAATTEIYGGLSFAVPLSPKVTWYRDVNMINGSYVQFSAGHSIQKIAKWNDDYYVGLSLSGSIAVAGKGYNSGYFLINETKANDFTLALSVPFNLKCFSITPSLNYSSMLDKEIGKATWDASRNNVWFGIALSKSF
jgi:hypothetical protein